MKDWGLKARVRGWKKRSINAAFKSSETEAKQDYFNLIPSVAVIAEAEGNART
jgi:hypothetical protein